MGVSRTIKIRILTDNTSQSNLIKSFTENFWNLKSKTGTVTSISEDDIDKFEYHDFPDTKVVYEILDKREKAKKVNALIIWDTNYSENIQLLIYSLENKYNAFGKHYELHFSPGIGKRILLADRYTDFSFYLNQLIPKLEAINCRICEVECRDFEF
ncbi:hypothetical protein [Lacihabitans lacunae]|uniref:DUF4265 domain-containing protein n=1 Tax=Lacihabitans lacunae TaxID=1028214 RepID=A0ABV7YQP4_9BACT